MDGALRSIRTMFVRWMVLCVGLGTLGSSAWATDAPAPSDAETAAAHFGEVLDLWRRTPSESSAERAAERLARDEVRRRFDLADDATDAELMARALLELQGNLAAQDLALLLQLVERAGEDRGVIEDLPTLDVDLTLEPTRTNYEANESWSVYARIHNRSDVDIWILDTATTLLVPSELWGRSGVIGQSPLFATFPTTTYKPEEFVRVPAGGEYAFYWMVDAEQIRDHEETFLRQRLAQLEEAARASASGSTPEHLQSEIDAARADIEHMRTSAFDWPLIGWVAGPLVEYGFFKPADYSLTAIAHLWAGSPPRLDDKARQLDLHNSRPITAKLTVSVGAPQMVMLLGSIFGGLVCFALRTLHQTRFGVRRPPRYYLSGLAIVPLLCGIGTTLIARLSDSEFIVAVKVQDLWGAIATGFVIQWLGLRYFVERFQLDGDGAEPATEEEGDPEAPVGGDGGDDEDGDDDVVGDHAVAERPAPAAGA